MNILVLSACSSDKLHSTDLDCEAVDTTSRQELVQEYPEAVASAAEMYTGREHQHVRTAVDTLRELGSVDWYVISAGFGLLDADTEIPAYDCTFSQMDSVRDRAAHFDCDVGALTNDETIRAVGRAKGIPQEFEAVLRNEFDVVFVVLGREYLLTVSEALDEIPKGTTAYAFAANGSKQFIEGCEWIPATETERQTHGTTWMELRGKQLRTLATNLTSGEIAGQLADRDQMHRLSHRTHQ